MRFKSFLAKLASKWIVPKLYAIHKNGIANQERLMLELTKKAAKTRYGSEHSFNEIKNYNEFKKAIPITDYEGLKHYIALIADGKANILWPGKPLYFCKSSGTTSGTKYIPLTKEAIDCQIVAARDALLCYVFETGKADFFDYKMIFLQGSPVLEKYHKIPTGRLSGIVYHHVPAYLHKNRLPSYKINCIEDWEEKVDAIAQETLHQNMSLISGIPPWVIMYFEKLIAISGKKTIKEIFPNFTLFAYGGVNYAPYRSKMEALIGAKIDSVETYPASEGFIAYQDAQKESGLLLNLYGGIFYEFIKADEIHLPNPNRIYLKDVEIGINYAIILNTNAGLWGYNIGDTIKFVSLNPYRIIVTGRTKHFISAFGEHVIGEEVESAMQTACNDFAITVAEFHVAPQVDAGNELPYHEWLIEFENAPADLSSFAERLDVLMQQKNSYYFDLRHGNILQRLKITALQKDAFNQYMKSIGKLGGQNKTPRLANDRALADSISKWKV